MEAQRCKIVHEIMDLHMFYIVLFLCLFLEDTIDLDRIYPNLETVIINNLQVQPFFGSLTSCRREGQELPPE
jgi:hypothetical protein